VIPRRTVLVLLLILSASIAEADHDSDISFLYSTEATGLYKNGNYNAARLCVHRALQFREDNSDALYIRGIIAQELGSPAAEAVDALMKAVNAGNWKTFSSIDGEKAAFRCYMEAGKYAEALKVLDAAFLGYTANTDLYYLYIQALEATGKTDDALKLARYASEKFEDDVRFKTALIRLDGSFKNRILEDIGAGRGDGYSLNLIEEALFSTSEPAVRRLITGYYLERGGDDLRVLIEDVRFRHTVSKDTLESLVEAGLFNDSKYLFTLHQYLQSSEARQTVRTLFDEYTGTMITGERNGVTVRSRYRKGRPLQIIAENGWNGDRVEVRFVDGTPHSFSVTEAGTQYKYLYGVYPYVKELEIMGRDDRMLYIMEHGVEMGILEQPVPDYPIYYLKDDIRRRSGDEYIDRAERVVTMVGEEYMSDRTRTVDGGIIVRESIEHIMDRMTILQQGEPVRAAADMDMDGRYETTVEYTNGDVSRIFYDGNGNNINEYFYYPGEVPREEWDFDEDGQIETREYTMDGTRYLEYDDDGDGTFLIYALENSIWRRQE